jgi:hypothetical protein
MLQLCLHQISQVYQQELLLIGQTIILALDFLELELMTMPHLLQLNTSSTNQVSTIVATPTLNACVGLPQTYSITVFPKPIASVPSNSEACPGDNVTGFVFGSTPNDPNTNYQLDSH